VFIDEIASIAPKRGEGSGGGGGRGMEKRIVAQLLTSMDSIHPKNTRIGGAVMVLGATNRPDAMDPALRRAGRFDREIVLGAPDERAREGIQRAMTRDMRVSSDLDYKLLARKTPGFVGADVRSLLKEAALIAINRIFRTDLLSGGGIGGGGGDDVAWGSEEGQRAEDDEVLVHAANGQTNDSDIPREAIKGDENTNGDVNGDSRNDVRSVIPLTPEQLLPLYVTMSDFLSAIPHVQPSSKREGFGTVPDVSWSDIGALTKIRKELTLSVLEPISHPERFEALGLPLPACVLLYGPPGCGKVSTDLPVLVGLCSVFYPKFLPTYGIDYFVSYFRHR
jgi:ribosome biogenesis ATPase